MLIPRLFGRMFMAIYRLHLGLSIRILLALWVGLWCLSYYGIVETFSAHIDALWESVPPDDALTIFLLVFIGVFSGIVVLPLVFTWNAGRVRVPNTNIHIPGAGMRVIGAALPFALFGLMTMAYQADLLHPTFEIAVWTWSEFPDFFVWSWGLLIAGIALIYAVMVIPARIAETNLYRQWVKEGKGGSARWAGPQAFARLERKDVSRAPIYLGRTTHKHDPWLFCRSIVVDDESHLVTIARTRSGKSTTAIWPNLAKYPPYPDSAFVLDPKGEHTVNTAHKRPGKSVVLDPFNETGGRGTSGFNPLAEIDPKSPRVKEDIAAIADGCRIPTATTSGADQHFGNVERALIMGIIAHVMTTEPPENHNLPTVYDRFLQLLGDEEFAVEYRKAMAENTACGGAPREAITLISEAGDREFGSIVTSTLPDLAWIASEGMRNHLMGGSFRLSQLRTEITTVYVVLDFDAMEAEKQGRYMRILINQAFNKCRTTPLPADRKDRRTLFVLDEVAQLGPMPSIANAYRTLAGSNIKIWTLFQNWEGLMTTTDGPNALMGNSTKQFFGCGDPETAQEIEKYLGEYRHTTSSGAEQQRSLLDSTEIMRKLSLDTKNQIVITASGEALDLARKTYSPPPYKPKPVGQDASKVGAFPQLDESSIATAPVPPPLNAAEEADAFISKTYREFFMYRDEENDPAMAARMAWDLVSLRAELKEKAGSQSQTSTQPRQASKPKPAARPSQPARPKETPKPKASNQAKRSPVTHEPPALSSEEDANVTIRNLYREYQEAKSSGDLEGSRRYAERLRTRREEFAAQPAEPVAEPPSKPASKPKTAKPKPVQKPAVEPAPDGLTDEQRVILDRYDLTLPIPKADVPGLNIKWVGRVPPHLVDQVNADFEVIAALAS